MLRNLPNLETVDLSHNLLGSLEIPSFVSLLELKMVNLDANFLKCDKPTQYLMDWFRKQAVRYSGPDCRKLRFITPPPLPPSLSTYSSHPLPLHSSYPKAWRR